MSTWELSCFLSLAAIVGAAVVTDLRERRIPNGLVLVGLAAGFALQTLAPDGDGLFARWWGAVGPLQGLYGLLTGLAIFLPMYALRTLGAGDVKLLAMLGVWFGPRPMIGIALLTLVCGGVLALSVALWTRTLRRVMSNLTLLVVDVIGRVPMPGAETPAPGPALQMTGRLPYAVAIAAGTALEIVVLKGWYR